VGALAASAVLLQSVSSAAVQREPSVSFSRDVQPIFNNQCVMCHNSEDPHAGLLLDEGLSHEQLVSMGSSETTQMARVTPGDPDKSYLVHKLNNTHLKVGGTGWHMPPPTHMKSAVTLREKELIRNWIKQGAKNN
jgi:uncharacterized membrane protein